MTNLSSDLREANPHLHIKGEYGCKKLIFAFGENRCRVTEMGMMGGSGGESGREGDQRHELWPN